MRGMKPTEEPVAAVLLNALRGRAGARGVMSYADFTELALFHPSAGYYATPRRRVGRSADTDFCTASSVGGRVFAALVREAASNLVGGADALREHTLVEVGAEPGESIFEGERDAFAGVLTVRLGDNADIPPRAVLFANELFDAQPFLRLICREGSWRELGVRVTDSGALAEVELDAPTPDAELMLPRLPRPWHDGFILDLSPAAERLMGRLLAGGWRGAAIFPDYGKTLREFLENCPRGTARAYRRHTQSNDLLAAPGEQDLTFHVDWDGLSARMREAGFGVVSVERQEAFFMKRSAPELERLFDRAGATRDMALMGRLRELLHPAHFGAKFQVLSGVRA